MSSIRSLSEIDYQFFNLFNDTYFFVVGAIAAILLPMYQDVLVSNAVAKGVGVRLIDIPKNLDVAAAVRTFVSTINLGNTSMAVPDDEDDDDSTTGHDNNRNEKKCKTLVLSCGGGSQIALVVSALLLGITACNLGTDVTAPPKTIIEAGSAYTGVSYHLEDKDDGSNSNALKAAMSIPGKPVNLCDLCFDYEVVPPASVKKSFLSDAWEGALPGVQFSRPSEEKRVELSYLGGFEPEGIDAPSVLWFVPDQGNLVEMTEGMVCEPVSGIPRVLGDRQRGVTIEDEPLDYCYPEVEETPFQRRLTTNLSHAIEARFPILDQDDMEAYRLGQFGSRIQFNKIGGTNQGPLLANWTWKLHRNKETMEEEELLGIDIQKSSVFQADPTEWEAARAEKEIAFMKAQVGGDWDIFRITGAHERGCTYLLRSMNATTDLITVMEGWEKRSRGCILYSIMVCRLDVEKEVDRIEADQPCYGVGAVNAFVMQGTGSLQATSESIALLMANVDTSETGVRSVRTYQSIFATTLVATGSPKEFRLRKERIVPNIGGGYYACVFLPLVALALMSLRIFVFKDDAKRSFRVPTDGFNWFLMGQHDMVRGFNRLADNMDDNMEENDSAGSDSNERSAKNFIANNKVPDSPMDFRQKPSPELCLGLTYIPKPQNEGQRSQSISPASEHRRPHTNEDATDQRVQDRGEPNTRSASKRESIQNVIIGASNHDKREGEDDGKRETTPEGTVQHDTPDSEDVEESSIVDSERKNQQHDIPSSTSSSHVQLHYGVTRNPEPLNRIAAKYGDIPSRSV